MEKIKRFFSVHQFELVFLLTVFMILALLSELPYINLIYSAPLLILILGFLGIFIFRLSSKFLIEVSLALLLVCFILLLIGSNQEAGGVGDLIYGFIFIAFVKELISFLKHDF